ncbi:MAG: SusC/RagA family TonB-linked outer membrane protein [Gemmatimonadota bacterium]|nr:SusC/RagA family TonB-linked outer membrane protein [Gemmatimonadota bacterium]
MQQGNRLSRWLTAVLTMLAVPLAAQAQGAAIITGKITSEAGQPLEAATVYITEMSIGVQTNSQGVYSLTIAAARVTGQMANVRVRAIGYRPDAFSVRVAAGRTEHDFVLKLDVNRLSEVVVTGSIEGTERAKVPFAIGRLTTEDVPVPSPNPVSALQGKVPGMRIAATGGQPGDSPEIMMRGPTSINATGRAQSPLIIVDGVIMRVGALNEIGGLDIESVEVVKGAAGASLYGASAANGVMIIKTKRGGSQDGVRFNVRSEYGFSDLNSLEYGQPTNHHLQLDETGTRFCVQGTGVLSGCSRTMNFMAEILRINNVNADTTRTPQTFQYNAPGQAELLNVYQAQIWPGQYYVPFAQISTRNAQKLLSVDATGRSGSTRYFVSMGYTDDAGAIKQLTGQQQMRARVNLDYEARRDLLFSVSTMIDEGRTDNHTINFGGLLRGAPAGVDYLVRDTLGRRLVRGGGPGIRGSGNGAGSPLYDSENSLEPGRSKRIVASATSTYFPAEWINFEANVGYDSRDRSNETINFKGYRTQTASTAANNGNETISDRYDYALNASVAATVRKQINADLNAKLNIKALYDENLVRSNSSTGQQYVVKDVFTLSNTSTNFSTSSSSSTIKNMGVVTGANVDYKGKYILDGTFRYDGSSLFGAGNRWAPFGRLSAVWRMSEESFWNVPKVTDARFRISRGTAGNTPSFNAQYETYSCNASGCSLGQAGNSQLTPETTTEVEAGVDFTLFDRVGVEVTHANSVTRDQILNAPTPSALGFTTQWKNAGSLQNKTWEVAASLPVMSRRDFQWNMRASFDRTTTYITELNIPEYRTGLFLMTANTDKVDGVPQNRYSNIWGRKFYKSCGELAASVQAMCGPGKDFQTNHQGYIVWVGAGNTPADGIKKNLWQSKLPAADSPWNYALHWGHPIIDRPLRGEKGERLGNLHILGKTLPDFRLSYSTTLTYKRLTVYGLLDGTFGHEIYNQPEGHGLFDFNGGSFDQKLYNVETAQPVGYVWRVGPPEGVGTGGFYDYINTQNSYNVENGSYAKLREVSLSYKLGPIAGVGDWTFGLVGRNMLTITNYTGYDVEIGAGGGQTGSGLINQVDQSGYPTLRTFTLSFTTRF